jgi:hypothetical protein
MEETSVKQGASDIFLEKVCLLTPDYMLCPRRELFSIKIYSHLTEKWSDSVDMIHLVQLRKTVFLINHTSGF